MCSTQSSFWKHISGWLRSNPNWPSYSNNTTNTRHFITYWTEPSFYGQTSIFHTTQNPHTDVWDKYTHTHTHIEVNMTVIKCVCVCEWCWSLAGHVCVESLRTGLVGHHLTVTSVVTILEFLLHLNTITCLRFWSVFESFHTLTKHVMYDWSQFCYV